MDMAVAIAKGAVKASHAKAREHPPVWSAGPGAAV